MQKTPTWVFGAFDTLLKIARLFSYAVVITSSCATAGEVFLTSFQWVRGRFSRRIEPWTLRLQKLEASGYCMRC
jgi:hypothetical protein